MMNWNFIIAWGTPAIIAVVGVVYFVLQDKKEARRNAAKQG
jgi:cbb3-type cytochrome oxidase subunit 3